MKTLLTFLFSASSVFAAVAIPPTDINPLPTQTVVGRSTAGTGAASALTTLPTSVQTNITQVGTLTANVVFGDTGEGVTFHGGGSLLGASGALTLTGSTTTVSSTFDANGNLSKFGATDGLIYIAGDNLAWGYSTDAAYTGLINYRGYNEGATRARSLIICDGQQNAIMTFNGTNKNVTIAGPFVESTNTLSGAGAVAVTVTTTKVTTTGALNALTLADGVDGQVKRIIHDVDGGSFVLTPTTKTGWSTFTSTAAGESISLQFVTTRGWIVIGSYLGTIAP